MLAGCVAGVPVCAWEDTGISCGAVNASNGELDVQKYPDVARKVKELFSNLKKIAFTLRESISATHNNWGALLYDAVSDKACFAPTDDKGYSPYEIRAIVDRIGGGDSFGAALIYALNDRELGKQNETALAFAAAASCLSHSISGDFNFSSLEEVITLMKGKTSGRIVR